MIFSHVLVSTRPFSSSWSFIFVIQLFSTKIHKYLPEFLWSWTIEILVENQKFWLKIRNVDQNFFGPRSWTKKILVKNQNFMLKIRNVDQTLFGPGLKKFWLKLRNIYQNFFGPGPKKSKYTQLESLSEPNIILLTNKRSQCFQHTHTQ